MVGSQFIDFFRHTHTVSQKPVHRKITTHHLQYCDWAFALCWVNEGNKVIIKQASHMIR